MRKTLYLILSTILLVGCVSQSEYDKLQEENTRLKQEIEKIKVGIEKNNIKWYSKDQAMNYLKDYYEFYQTDLKFKNAKIRRISDNEFLISLKECLKDIDYCYAKVWTLTIDNKGNYTMNY